MLTRLRVLIAAVVVLAALPAAATAASPKKGGTYKGETSNGVKLVLKVEPSGKTGKADLFCSRSHISAIRSFPITGGRFRGIRKTGDVKIFSIKGRFTTQTTAKVTVSLKAACAGGDHQLTLSLAS
ncbi:MAG TPA: hypothetical protein VGJ70_04720 [Solirubrobacteraceae bacterium]|jgi:hypothetical protein